MVELGKVSDSPWVGTVQGIQMFIAYQSHYGKEFSPVDRDPNTYSGIAVFIDEVEGLRYANKHGLKLITIHNGETLESAIQRSLMGA